MDFWFFYISFFLYRPLALSPAFLKDSFMFALFDPVMRIFFLSHLILCYVYAADWVVGLGIFIT
ncbi:hypothetical protein KR52_12775 [Synechococcus sp. KORDI-52]|nr:hypothetical protein KR52_12775 [Synechococcus sp. KORDI-52]